MSSKRTKSITASLVSRNKEEKGANIECLFDKVYLFYHFYISVVALIFYPYIGIDVFIV